MASLAGILIIFIMLSVSVNVLMRYVLDKPLSWVIELNEYALLYITFLASAWVARKDAHVKVDIVMNWVGPKAKTVLTLISALICFIVMVVIVIQGVEVAWDLFKRGVYNPTLLMFPKAPLVAIIPVGCFFLAFVFMHKVALAWNELGSLRVKNKH